MSLLTALVNLVRDAKLHNTREDLGAENSLIGCIIDPMYIYQVNQGRPRLFILFTTINVNQDIVIP
jgi:hypothetical protein